MLLALNRASLALPLILFCTAAEAHSGHGNNFFDGVLHPLIGLDHLIAMTLIGVWAAQLGGRQKFVVPFVFVCAMALSALVGMSHIAVSIGDSNIAASVLIMGLLIAFSVHLKTAFSALLVGLFAIFHGYLHGIEMPAQANRIQYGCGFILATIMLHLCGVYLAGWMREKRWAFPAVGISAFASGVWLLAASAP